MKTVDSAAKITKLKRDLARYEGELALRSKKVRSRSTETKKPQDVKTLTAMVDGIKREIAQLEVS